MGDGNAARAHARWRPYPDHGRWQCRQGAREVTPLPGSWAMAMPPGVREVIPLRELMLERIRDRLMSLVLSVRLFPILVQ